VFAPTLTDVDAADSCAVVVPSPGLMPVAGQDCTGELLPVNVASEKLLAALVLESVNVPDGLPAATLAKPKTEATAAERKAVRRSRLGNLPFGRGRA
jgi:hypothetical protein